MALVIETGAGIANADSYATSAEYIAFVSDYFGEVVVGDDPAMRRAFYYMQGLRWKSGVYPLFGGAIPQHVKYAQILFARSESQSPSSLSPAVTLAGQKVLNKVDSIGWQVTGPGATVENSRPIVTAAFDFLRPYLDFDPARDSSIGITGVMVA